MQRTFYGSALFVHRNLMFYSNIIILYIFIFMGCFAVMSFILDGFMAFSWFKLTVTG